MLDTSTGEWTTLPEDPLKPSVDRVITSTRHGLVLTAKPIGSDGGSADPALVHAALLAPGESDWRTLPPSDQLGGWPVDAPGGPLIAAEGWLCDAWVAQDFWPLRP